MHLTIKLSKLSIAIFTLVTLLFFTIYIFKLEALGWYFYHNLKEPIHPDAMDLSRYQVTIDALRLPNIKNASDLSYNTERNTLLTVLNQESKIIELDVQGNILRVVEVIGVDDMEGITHIAGNRYVISDERDNRLIAIEMDDTAKMIDVRQSPRIKLGINPVGNKNFEGISWDYVNKRLLVAKERDPKYIMSVRGFFDADKSQPLNIDIKKFDVFDKAIRWSLRDLSAVTYIPTIGHLLLLSDESRLIKEYDEEGNALSALALWKGFHGLKAHVPQAEGIAVGKDKSIYIISEPNLFYVFKPKAN
jgi:uncharacterized protein YjiK